MTKKLYNDEQPTSDLKDIEDGGIKSTCYACRKPQTRLVRLSHLQRFASTVSVKTKSIIGICTNEPCWRYTDARKVSTWVREDLTIPDEVPQGASRTGALV